ncbi:MAG: sulfite exporter TauE/SafE family protein [Anaerolineaceae bacterium]
MTNILIAFITGLTTGGLSCLAVQGGLLASTLANEIEKDYLNAGLRKRRSKANQHQNRSKFALIILVFLLAKLIAYSILGFLLGLVGQAFQLSPYARAFLQIAIGIFMLGSALHMLNVHPIFRYFVIEPPAFIRRRLRKTASEADNSSLVTSAFLGFMTVLIPCGVTQTMMAVALSTADPLQGAALMFAFTLGTSPVFFVVTYFVTQLGAKLEKHFTRFAAIVILVLAVITIDSGLTLAGSPVSLTRWTSKVIPQSSEAAAFNSGQELKVYGPSAPDLTEGGYVPTAEVNENLITINVENSGYYPNEVHAKAGIPIKLRLITENVQSCSRSFIISKLGIQQILESTGEAVIEIPAQVKGAQINYSCSMGMYSGAIIFDL